MFGRARLEVWDGVSTLLIAFFSTGDLTLHATEDGVTLSVAGTRHELDPETATALRAALGEALSRRRTFVHTVGRHRPDGTYVVERRGADSAGNSVVFDSFAALERLYDRLPATIDAEAVGRAASVTGSRRHLVVRHFAEHPAFDCAVDSRCPLRVTTAGDR